MKSSINKIKNSVESIINRIEKAKEYQTLKTRLRKCYILTVINQNKKLNHDYSIKDFSGVIKRPSQ
jgi:hypothetical protein